MKNVHNIMTIVVPQLLLVLFTTSTIVITAISTATTTATTTVTTTNDNSGNKKCIRGSKIRIKWPLKDLWKFQVVFQLIC